TTAGAPPGGRTFTFAAATSAWCREELGVWSDHAVTEETRKGAGLDTLLEVWSRRKWLAILAFAFPLAAGVSLTAFLLNIYRSTATVLVDRQQIPETFVQATVTSAL